MRLVLLCPGDSIHTLPWVEAVVDAGHTAIVYAYPPVRADFSAAHLVRTVEGRGPVARARWIRRALVTDSPDIVSIHYASTDAFALSRARVPLVASVWGSDILRDLDGRPLKRAIIVSALRRASLVVSPAAHMTSRLLSMGVSAERVVTAQYGVDTSVVRCQRSAVAAPVRVLSTRSLAPVYRVADLVDAVSLLDPALVSEVRIAGAGPLTSELQARAACVGALGRATFLGRLESGQVIAELCSSHIYVSTSESDGTSLSLLEAMACSLPCIVTDIRANREWIDESCGALVPVGQPSALAEAIGRIAADADARQKMGEEARRRVVERGDRSRNMHRILAAVERLNAGMGAQR